MQADRESADLRQTESQLTLGRQTVRQSLDLRQSVRQPVIRSADLWFQNFASDSARLSF